MTQSNRSIIIPDTIVSDFELEKGQELELKVINQQLIITTQKTSPSEFQAISLRWFLVPAILMSGLFYCFFAYKNQAQIPMTGEISIASMVIILGILSGISCFSFCLIKHKQLHKNNSLKSIYWRNIPTIIFSFLVILGLTLLGFFWIIGLVFEGASFDPITATILFLLFTSMINYVMIYAALSFSSSMLIKLLISVIIGGVLFAMITNSQSQWWQYNFSFLGTNEAVNSWPFNLTIMLSSLLMIALIDYLFTTLRHHPFNQKKLMILRILLTLVAICLGGVGFFPNNGTGQLHILHTKSASYLVYFIIILILTIRWLLPKMTREFLAFSYSIAGILIISDILFEYVGYFSLTVFELIAFALAFSWLLLLLQHIQKLSMSEDVSFKITIE